MNNQRLMDIYNTVTIASLDEIRDMANDLMDLQDKVKAKPEPFRVEMDDQGNVIIPLADYLREVATEVKEELAKDNFYSFPMWTHVAEHIATEFASEHFNTTTDKIRERLLTSDYMPELVRNWASGKMSDLNFANSRASHYMNWAYKLYHWIYANVSSELAREMPPIGEYQNSYTDHKVVDACVAEFNALGATFPDPPEDTDA